MCIICRSLESLGGFLLLKQPKRKRHITVHSFPHEDTHDYLIMLRIPFLKRWLCLLRLTHPLSSYDTKKEATISTTFYSYALKIVGIYEPLGVISIYRLDDI